HEYLRSPLGSRFRLGRKQARPAEVGLTPLPPLTCPEGTRNGEGEPERGTEGGRPEWMPSFIVLQGCLPLDARYVMRAHKLHLRMRISFAKLPINLMGQTNACVVRPGTCLHNLG